MTGTVDGFGASFFDLAEVDGDTTDLRATSDGVRIGFHQVDSVA
ncbi:hypothetical protein [Nocardiopsis baichengensis]|nr:hypothetical protein [Nocardiopsis baichengensis]